MEVTLQELSEYLKLEFSGDGKTLVHHACGIENLCAGGLSYITNPHEMANLPTPAGIFDSRRKSIEKMAIPAGAVIIVPMDISGSKHNFLYSKDPLSDHAKAIEMIYQAGRGSGQIHPQDVIGKNTEIGSEVTIDANAVV